jgi:4-amino-4-deoxy-L-arabinose transferase-like glycosyltransferase
MEAWNLAPPRFQFPRTWPEIVVAIAASLIFMGFLGRLELWGKREQRAAAEALDTVRNHHWLVAEIQGRPRLEKPPLPRWTTAVLLAVTGHHEEWLVRLPGAISALATVALVYRLGARMGGRTLALASTSVLCTTGLFISELRQAGNDGPLALFTTMALEAAWCCLHGTRRLGSRASRTGPRSTREPMRRAPVLRFHAALGLGFLCKGPIILPLVGLTVILYLSVQGEFRAGLRRLADRAGLILFLLLALCWPVPVLLNDPNALGVWGTEIGQKTGVLGIAHQQRLILGLALPVMAMPWPVAAMTGILLPLLRNRHVRVPWRPSSVWFPWFWSMGNLAIFSTWQVAKPNYFIPCLPGLALLSGMALIRLSRGARATRSGAPLARRAARLSLFLQALTIVLTGLLAPMLAPRFLTVPTELVPWLAAVSACVMVGMALAFWAWKRGQEATALLPITAACAAVVLIGYGMIGPADNPLRGHAELARQLDQLIPANIKVIHFFHEIDEGLWFYLDEHRLSPVPGSQPRYSDSFDKVGSLVGTHSSAEALPGSVARLRARQLEVLKRWLEGRRRNEPYLLIRSPLHDRLPPDFQALATPLYRETGVKRNGLVLLQARDRGPVIARIGSGPSERP